MDEQFVLFVPLPAKVDEQARRVNAEIFGEGTFQLVAMAEPLKIVEMVSLEGKSSL